MKVKIVNTRVIHEYDVRIDEHDSYVDKGTAYRRADLKVQSQL